MRSREGQLGALWRKAGLTEVQEQPLTIEQRYASFKDYWTPFRPDGPFTLKARAWCVRGNVPAA